VKITRAIYPIIAVAALAACSSAESDWQKAQAQNTAAAYEDFVKQHPNDAHAKEAQDRLQKLQDEAAWADAQKTNTADGYQQYLQKEPNGAHADDAHTQITALARADAWKTAQSANTAQALQDFLQKYSTGPEADQARAQLEKLQGYRVQLATARDEKAADKARAQLQTKFGGDLHDLVVIPPSGSEKLHRVTSGPMTEDDAKAACAKLKKEHQHCEVVTR
jgi:outer membrane protein assembly factor BamD (BamD/ComL family)